MKKILLLLIGIVLLVNLGYATIAQIEPDSQAVVINALKSKLNELQTANRTLADSLRILNVRVAENANDIHDLDAQLRSFDAVVEEVDRKLSGEIDSANTSMLKAEESNKTKFRRIAAYVGGGFLVTLAGFLFLYFFLRHRIRREAVTINEIREVQRKIQEESVKLDNKFASIIERENIAVGDNGDHSLALKVADEVVRIEMNLFRMDKTVKGYKQLSKAIERIKNNFTAQGYEIVDLLGAPYNEGMRINADFVVDESLADGAQIITSITKPQINYKGRMIQKAIVTVSQNI